MKPHTNHNLSNTKRQLPFAPGKPSTAGRRWLAAHLAILLCTFIMVTAQPAAASGSNLLFGYRVAGSYLIENLAIPAAGLQDLQALATLTADGGAVATDSDDFGLAATAPHSPKQGSWKRTGKRRISITVLEFAYDADGIHDKTWRLEFTATFDDRNFTTGSGELVAKLYPVPYLPGSHPLDPDAVPFFVGTGSFDFRRIMP